MKGHNYGKCLKCGVLHQHPKGMAGKFHSDKTRKKIARFGKDNQNYRHGLGSNQYLKLLPLKHPEKYKARYKLRNAVAYGKLKKPILCKICLRRKPLQGHHPDYCEPLKVIWLCKSCHEGVHHGSN